MADTLAQRLRTTVADRAGSALWTEPFLLVCGTHLLAYGSYAAVNPTFAAFVGTVTHRESLVGVAVGVFTFAAVAARPIAGRLLDRIDRRLVQGVAVVGLAAGTVSFAWAPGIRTLILLRVGQGLAWGVSSTATPVLAAAVVPAEHRAEGFAYFGVVPNLALVVLAPIGFWLAHRFGFGAQFAAAALLGLLALIPLTGLDAAAASTDRVGELSAPAMPSRAALPTALPKALPTALPKALPTALPKALPTVRPAAVFVGLASVPVGAVETLVPLYGPTVGLSNVGLFFTVMGAAIIVVRAGIGRLPGSTAGLLSSSFLLQATGVVVLALGPRLVVVRGLPLGLLGGAAIFGAGFALVFPVLQDVAITATRADRLGSATATLLVGMDLGIGVGAIVAGGLAELAGFTAAYVLAAIVPCVGALATLLQRSTWSG